MELLEFPITDESDEPAASFAEQEIDLAAFRLWRGASRLDSVMDDAVDAEGAD